MPNSDIYWLRMSPVPSHSIGLHEIGGTLEWLREDQTPVLFPQQELSIGDQTKLRGGMPLCFPIHGRQEVELSGCDLPQHGLVRNMRWVSYNATTGRCQFEYPGSDSYVWPFACWVEILNRDLHGFTHRVVIERSRTEGTGLPFMPVGGGLHPYFATYGESFAVRGGNWSVQGSDVVPGESVIMAIDASPVRVMTCRSTIRLHALLPYTHVVIWSDSPEDYICVEPVVNRYKFGVPGPGILLGPGERQAFVCGFSYQ